MLHAFSRSELLIGTSALNYLKTCKVAIFGIGGVGTFVAEGLIRSGVGNFVLIDKDDICLTNLNRQIHATTKTIGRSKVEAMKERMLDINPEATIEIHHAFYLPENREEMLSTDYDYIIDAVDTIAAKIDLAHQAQELGIPIISSMGAGNKLDPTRFEIADISKTSVCPLARVMRQELRKRGIKKLKVVYSKETPLTPIALPDPEATTRRSLPGSMSFVPSVVGLIIASEVVKDLIAKYEAAK